MYRNILRASGGSRTSKAARRIAVRGREDPSPQPAATIAPLAVPYNARPRATVPPSTRGRLVRAASFFCASFLCGMLSRRGECAWNQVQAYAAARRRHATNRRRSRLSRVVSNILDVLAQTCRTARA
jgi:hypothetical protein